MYTDLVRIVYEFLEAEKDYQDYCRKTCKEKGLSPGSSLYIPTLKASTAHRLGELSERSMQKGFEIADICTLLDLDQDLLLAAMKSAMRWEKHNGLYDRVLHISSGGDDETRLLRFLRTKEDGQFYESTGRRKAWCEKGE